MGAVAAILAWIGASFFGKAVIEGAKLAKKIAVIAAIIVAFFAAITVLATAIEQALNTLSAAVPGGWVAAGVALLPGSVPYCISAILAAHAAVWVFRTFYAVAQFKVTL